MVATGASLLKAVFNEVKGNIHVVPLSGGLDSRVILGGLLSHYKSAQINTITYGTPGTLDYDIGNYVAKKMGTCHEIIDLTQVKLKQDFIQEVAMERRPSWTYLLMLSIIV